MVAVSEHEFVADRGSVVLIKRDASGDPLSAAGPIRIDVSRSSAPTMDSAETWGMAGILTPEDWAVVVSRCLNVVGMIDPEDPAAGSEALEILMTQQLASMEDDRPDRLMKEALKYVLKQERWRFEIIRDVREDGVRLRLDNPNGAPVPLSIHVSTRGKTPSFWVMEENRLLQGSHAFKIPIQAASALREAVQAYLDTRDVGLINPFGG